MPTPLAILRPAPLSTRLWQGGGLVAAVVLTVVVMNFVLPPDRTVGRSMLGHDFLAFYTAGTLVRDGRPELLYDLSTTRQVQQEVGTRHGLDLGDGFGPFWNPPFYALAFAPLAGLPYPAAAAAWVAFNVLCAAGAIAILCRIVARAAGVWAGFGPAGEASAWRYWLLVPLIACFSMPFLQALSHGQNTFTSLLLLAGAVALWRSRRAFAAGAVCGLLFYKPQLAAVVAAMITITLGWRALAGLALSGGCLLAAGEIAMPGTLALYLKQLPVNLAFLQVDSAYLWERHATLKSFWRLLLQGRGAGEMAGPAMIAWAASAGLVALGLAAAAWNTLRQRRFDDPFDPHTRARQTDRLIAATIAAMPLLMPFYFDYDLLLLAIPFTLLSAERLAAPPAGGTPVHEHDRTLAKVAAMLFAWLMVNPGVARDGGINVTVLLVAAVAGLFIARACRDRARGAIEIPSESPGRRRALPASAPAADVVPPTMTGEGRQRSRPIAA